MILFIIYQLLYPYTEPLKHYSAPVSQPVSILFVIDLNHITKVRKKLNKEVGEILGEDFGIEIWYIEKYWDSTYYREEARENIASFSYTTILNSNT